MRAVGLTEFGGPEVLQVFELAEPHAGSGEVRIKVAAAAVNPTDTGLRAGLYGAGLRSSSPHIPGMDAAGVIDEVGAGVDWEIGEKVMAILLPATGRGGAYAEYVVVPAQSVARIPAGSDLVSAASLPMNGLTARLSLDQLNLKKGQSIAVTGAAGAYGGYVVQLAKADGLYVVADASEADEELVRSLGADAVVRRGPDVADRIREIVPAGVDGLADGAVQTDMTLPAIRDAGGLAVIRGWAGPTEREIALHQTWVRDYATNHAALDRLRQQVEDGEVTLRIAATYSAEDAASAHRRLEAGGTRGRLVLTF
ncbi:MAG: putative zinc-binding oxidoreductase [Frankiales bacterium]|nr:putative zinc-binding oxidoreductase [Frankiales bacterium]